MLLPLKMSGLLSSALSLYPPLRRHACSLDMHRKEKQRLTCFLEGRKVGGEEALEAGKEEEAEKEGK